MTRLTFTESLRCSDWRQSTQNVGYATTLSQDYLILGLRL
jgi:hypothetical protein